MKNKTTKPQEDYIAEFEQELDYLFKLVLRVNMNMIDVQILEDRRKEFTNKYGKQANII